MSMRAVSLILPRRAAFTVSYKCLNQPNILILVKFLFSPMLRSFFPLLFSFDLINLFSWFERGVALNSLLCADGAVKNLLTQSL